jgi:3-oxoacyl-[acyl-carrier protein] reductase
MFELTGKVALVTGAGQGMGAGIAQALARQGARVAVNDLDEARAEALAKEIRDGGMEAIAAPFDVTELQQVEAGVERIVEGLGPVDILVNNAGNAGAGPTMELKQFREMPADEWRRFIDINLYGPANCCKAVVDGMCQRGSGRIITISSGAGQTGLPIGITLYGAGKAGALGFQRHLATELAGDGVTVNAVALGLMNNVGNTDVVKGLASSQPTGRLGTPEDAGAAVVYLASDEASWVTGQVLGVNGGTFLP